MAVRLETERLILRRLTRADLDWLAELHGDSRVIRYIDDGNPVPRAVVVEQILPGLLREYDELPEGLGWFAVTGRPSGTPLGWAGLRPPSSHGLDRTAADTAELGYRLLPAAWRRGYATEAARALLGSAVSDLGLRQVVATTMTVNQASRRVLDKAGLSLVRTFYAAWPSYLEGAEHGDVEYAAVNATSQARATGHR